MAILQFILGLIIVIAILFVAIVLLIVTFGTAALVGAKILDWIFNL